MPVQNEGGKRFSRTESAEVLRAIDREIAFYRKRSGQVFFFGLFVEVLIVAGKQTIALPSETNFIHPFFETGLFIAVVVIGILLGAEYRSRIHILKDSRTQLLCQFGFENPVYPTPKMQSLSEIQVLYVVLLFTSSCGVVWSWLSSPLPLWVNVLGRGLGVLGVIISVVLLLIWRFRPRKAEQDTK